MNRFLFLAIVLAVVFPEKSSEAGQADEAITADSEHQGSKKASAFQRNGTPVMGSRARAHMGKGVADCRSDYMLS